MSDSIILHPLKSDVENIMQVVSGNAVSLTLTGRAGWRALYLYDIRANCEWMVDLLADSSKEIGRIYTSPIDGRQYTEWYARPLHDDSVVTEQGILCRVEQLPNEEFE